MGAHRSNDKDEDEDEDLGSTFDKWTACFCKCCWKYIMKPCWGKCWEQCNFLAMQKLCRMIILVTPFLAAMLVLVKLGGVGKISWTDVLYTLGGILMFWAVIFAIVGVVNILQVWLSRSGYLRVRP